MELTSRAGAKSYCTIAVGDPSPEGLAYVPYGVMEGLGVREGETVALRVVRLPRAESITLRPSTDLASITEDPEVFVKDFLRRIHTLRDIQSLSLTLSLTPFEGASPLWRSETCRVVAT